MTRFRAALIFFALWACIYLPGLGSTELKGEEGRRILPAVTMLNTGNWLVPYVGGKPFLRKPPLINWAIAGSFALTGVRNEWTARLPSTLCVLLLGLTIIACGHGRGWMDAETALLAAIMSATSFGLLAKARFAGAEIEGIYVPLAGIAQLLWMAWWTQGRSPWLTWTVPWIVHGVASLAKGPIHLIMFYPVVIGVLWKAKPRALRELLCPAHFVGLAIMTAIFATWAVPYFHSELTGAAAQVWQHQLESHVTDATFDLKGYLLNIPRGLMDELPWLLFAPLVFAARADDPRRAALIQGARLAVAFCLIVLLLWPWGMLPRYVLPLTLPWSVLVAFALENHPARRWVLIAAAVLAAGSILYGAIAVRFISRHDNLRPIAAQIDAAVPPGKVLIILDPEYLAEIFYLHSRFEYAADFDDIPADAEFVLARKDAVPRLARKRPDLVVTRTYRSWHNGELFLLQPGAAVPEDARPVVPKPDASHR